MSQDNRGLRSFAQDTLNAPTLPIGAYLRVRQEPTTGGVTLAGPDDDTIGITDEPTLLAGDFVEVAMTTFPGTRKVVCASTCNPGDHLFPTTNGQVDTSAGGGLGTNGSAIGPCAFIALESCATAGGVVEALPWTEVLGTGLVFSQIADSATLTATATETDYGVDCTVPANDLRVGDVISIRARVVQIAENASDTLAIKLYLGSVTLVSMAAAALTANQETLIAGEFIVTAIGSTGKVQGSALTVQGTVGTATAREASLASTTIDTTGANKIKVTGTYSSNNAGNQSVLRDVIVKISR